MTKFFKIFSTVVVILFFLSLFGWMVNQIATKNKDYGVLTEPIKFMYTFFDLFEQSVEEVQSLPRTFVPTHPKFESVNLLEQDVFALSTYSDTNDTRTIILMNLRNDSIYRKWNFPHPIKKPWIEIERIVNPILCQDGSLIYNFYQTRYPGLTKVDPEGKVLWVNDSVVVHHGMNLNKDGDIWACTQTPGSLATGKYTTDGKSVFYNDYTITKYDGESGEILFHKSITEILRENNMAHYILKGNNTAEPIHLNDVQPALKDGPYYKEDDVFISLRNMSSILHYRPSTNKLINYLEGPFINQHDVDILDDSSLAIFNNNAVVEIKRTGKAPHNNEARLNYAGNFFANIVRYDFPTDSFSIVGEEVFRGNWIYTINEGLMEFIDTNTYFVEEQNEGVLWVIRDETVLYKNVLKSPHEGYHHLPNWTRIIKNYE